LATAQYGTALGVARWLNDAALLDTLFCTETRPYNQGARLTAYECIVDSIPYCLVSDSMVAALMASRRIHAVVVGADRVAANGDTANKIGTHQLAILAKHFGVAFYVAAPLTTLDGATASGDHIVVEERPAVEFITTAQALPETKVWNPAFDVTPAALIDAIFTEHGVITKPTRTSSADDAAGVLGGLLPAYLLSASDCCVVRARGPRGTLSCQIGLRAPILFRHAGRLICQLPNLPRSPCLPPQRPVCSTSPGSLRRARTAHERACRASAWR
jgi:hypothetical protein